MPTYRLCGELIESEVELTRVRPVCATTRPSLRVARVRPGVAVSGVVHRIPDVCVFWVDADRVWVEPGDGVSDAELSTALVGPILAVWLHLHRRVLCLHASAARIANVACLFAGDCGAGKSTIARAMIDHGCTVWGDDLSVIDLERLELVPTHPELRLWPSSLARFPEDYPSSVAFEGLDKRAIAVDDAFERQGAPLAHIFLIEQGDRVAVVPATTAEAVHGLVRHTWGSLLLGYAMHDPSVHLDRVASVMSAARAWRLVRTADLTDLPAVVAAVFEVVESSP